MSEKTIDPKKFERAIRKIKHCLALSQSSNVNEAATAMRQAQMRKYHLSETDVKVSDAGEAESSMSRAARRPLWDQQLSAVVAKVFNVKALLYTHWCETKKNRVERAKFVGGEPCPAHRSLRLRNSSCEADPSSKRLRCWSARWEAQEQIFHPHCRRSLRHSLGVRR
ncbi:hypothetical protein CFBP2118_02416 [Pseudomonas syringae pv. syringae]|nr:hypothetical protein CFBP2118_02416 [Pseudomonas syringae pv. syringae]